MAVQALLYGVVLLSTSISSPLAQPSDVAKPAFAFSWLDDKNTFIAGDTATIKVIILGDFDPGAHKHVFAPVISVNGKAGNSTFVSGLGFDFGGDLGSWCISFTTILVGVFNVLITEDYFAVLDSSLHYYVNPGSMYPAVSVASWMDSVNEFEAGTRALVLILPKDAFGNLVPSTNTELNSYTFPVSASFANGSAATVLSVTSLGWNKFGYLRIEFIAATAGDLLLHIERENQTCRGSPLPFKVRPGSLDISRCVAKWRFGTNTLQLFSKAEIIIYQIDQFQNLVPGLYPFDAELVEQGTNLSIPVADLLFREVSPGIQLLSFTAMETGDFLFIIYDTKHNKSISNMPYNLTVFVGYCDGAYSIVNGSGLNTSIAGEKVKFSVSLKDKYQYPSPVELGKLQVQIVHNLQYYSVLPVISPVQMINGTNFPLERSYYGVRNVEFAPASSAEENTSLPGTSKVLANVYEVAFTPEKSGDYNICVSCGNILLNGGLSFKKKVKAGEVNTSLSGVVKYAAKVQKQMKNEIIVKLVDSFYNPVVLQHSKLNLEIASINNSGFVSWMFVDNNDGSYMGHYLVKDVGTYELCASFDGYRFLPCPFGVNAYSSEYFPKAYDDPVSVWEDESVSFDVLANDYFAGGTAAIIELSHPHHGSLLQIQKLFRYTPFKGFYGNDSFSYTISDINGNAAMASVYISVLSIPPQFVSFPTQLQVSEDVISPKFGGFPGFEVTYPDMTENISVTASAQFGTIYLSPMLMQFWQPVWSSFSVTKENGGAKTLTLAGHKEVINIALQSIQYIGDENFYGDDTIQIFTRNNNGVNYLNVSIMVQPVNDPPFINIPEYIILEGNDHGNGTFIYGNKRDKFEFLIGDPDFDNFPGEKSQFLVTCSVEVASGMLEVSLPAELINTTELKLKNSYQWQPLQTFVTISKHFMVMAKGLRFDGTISDCNSIIQQLKYHGGDYGTVLTVTVNDMGNFGCYPDCTGNVSKPLFVEAHTNLIKRRPITSKAAQVLGSAIIIEFVMVLSLGVALLFYTCKCAFSLLNERSSTVNKMKNTTPRVQTSDEQTPHHQSRERMSRKTVGYSSRSSGDHMPEAPATCFRSLSIEKRRIES
ncbi:hypothetical protein Dimus_029374 [Dionaea muscipula]